LSNGALGLAVILWKTAQAKFLEREAKRRLEGAADAFPQRERS
jgi:hypothetical protein